MIICGIDPGKKGAIARIMHSGRYEVCPMPDTPRGILDEIFRIHIDRLYIEKAQSMPGQGVVSVFNYGHDYGMIKGMLLARGVPFEEVGPRKWKIAMGVTCPPKSTNKERKLKATRAAQQLFPDATLVGPKGGLLDGLAEALLIAEYGIRQNYQPPT